MNWTIIGCGWLGTSLAETLLENGSFVCGTTTSIERLKSLENKGIKTALFHLNSQISTELVDFSEMVVISIPPFNKSKPMDYAASLLHLVQQFKTTTRFLFLGSTGIYPQISGLYTEEYVFKIDEQNSSLYQAEKALGAYLKKRLTILRLGGLFGEDRHPIHHLSGKSGVKNPLGKINFAGKNDIISIIQLLIKKDKLGGIYNIVYPAYPTREVYYNKKANQLNLAPPIFEMGPSIQREISSNKIQLTLDFNFKQTI